MGWRKGSFASIVARAIADLSAKYPAGVPLREVRYALDLPAERAGNRRLQHTVRDLKVRGKVRHVGVGLYLPAVAPDPLALKNHMDDGRARMWRALRLRHKRGEGVTAVALARAADVGPTYAKAFMRTLCRRGIVARVGRTLPAVYRMVQDPVEMPTMDDNAIRLRRMRRRRRALAEIDAARAALERAVGILEDDDETDT